MGLIRAGFTLLFGMIVIDLLKSSKVDELKEKYSFMIPVLHFVNNFLFSKNNSEETNKNKEINVLYLKLLLGALVVKDLLL